VLLGSLTVYGKEVRPFTDCWPNIMRQSATSSSSTAARSNAIAHGFATLGTIGFEDRRDYAAIGTVPNVASRLCDEAKPGQILISPRVLLAVDKAVAVEPVGEFNLKGIRRPMSAYNVLSGAVLPAQGK
jgi:class 3 adenylate cyclase